MLQTESQLRDDWRRRSERVCQRDSCTYRTSSTAVREPIGDDRRNTLVRWFKLPGMGERMFVSQLKMWRIGFCLLVSVPPCLGQDSKSSVETGGNTESSVVGTPPPAAPDAKGEPSPEGSVDITLDGIDPADLPEGYQEELEARINKFRNKRLELEQAVGDQREIYIRYLNHEERSPERREAFLQQRDKVRVLLDELYLAGLGILQMGVDEESATFVTTMILHRSELDIYDAPTMEGAARLIDAGSHVRYLFQTAARSAVVCGEFDMAKNIYVAMQDEDQEEVDLRLEYNLDDYRTQFESEQAIREVEILEDRLPRVRFKTTQGEFVVELFLDQAPSTVSHFIQLVEDGFYDGLDFFQVIDHLLALSGDPAGLGTGHSGRFLQDEHTRPDARKGLRGSLVMAKFPQPNVQGSFVPNSGSSQFAILLMPILAASEEQTVFGTVIEGMDVVSRLRRVDPHKEKKKGETTFPPDSILEAKVIRRPDVLPEPQYVIH